jgi:deazaflavin-dependent oxidoreductase (nitroreductase family)
VARFNRVATNRVARPLAGRVPPFAIVVHTGRRSGRVYRTPVMAFRSPEGWVLALTYGRDADWVRNVLAGDSALERRGRTIPIARARVISEGGRRMCSRLARPFLWLLRVDEALVLSP